METPLDKAGIMLSTGEVAPETESEVCPRSYVMTSSRTYFNFNS